MADEISMSMEQWWVEAERKKRKNPAKNLSQHQFIQQKTYINRRGIKPEPPQ
jgi:hypothetical protein